MQMNTRAAIAHAPSTPNVVTDTSEPSKAVLHLVEATPGTVVGATPTDCFLGAIEAWAERACLRNGFGGI